MNKKQYNRNTSIAKNKYTKYSRKQERFVSLTYG